MSYSSESEDDSDMLKDGMMPQASTYFSFPPPRKFGKRKCKARHVLFGNVLFLVGLLLPLAVLVLSIFAFIPRKTQCNPTPICYEISGICASACALLIGVIYAHWFFQGKRYPLLYPHVAMTIVFLGCFVLTVVSYSGFSMPKSGTPPSDGSLVTPHSSKNGTGEGQAPTNTKLPIVSKRALTLLQRFPPFYVAVGSTWAISLVVGLGVWVIAMRTGRCKRRNTAAPVFNYESDSNSMLLQ